MEDISRLPHQLDRKKRECKAIIETPKGHRNKFKYEPDSGLFALSNVLPQGFSFPFEFGFIPSTEGQDGDPLDVLVLMDEPAHVGCILPVRLIGVVELVQTENGKQTKNDRLLAVAVKSVDYADIKSVSKLPHPVVEQIKEFLELYNKNSGKQDEVKGVAGPERAIEILDTAIQAFAKKQQK